MINAKKILGLIPARGGSKRLPGKNVRPLNGVPLIELTIQVSYRSRYIDKTIVSTDSAEIAKIAESCGAEVPFFRPESLSTDTSTSVDVAIHALDLLQSRGQHFDYLLLLQPTSPLRTEEHIDQAIELLVEKEADAVVGVTDLESTAEWSGPLEEDLQVPWLATREQNHRSCEVREKVKINGAIYLIDSKKLKGERTFFLKEKIYGLMMDKDASLDIDTKLDFDIAEFLMERKNDSNREINPAAL